MQNISLCEISFIFLGFFFLAFFFAKTGLSGWSPSWAWCKNLWAFMVFPPLEYMPLISIASYRFTNTQI